MDFGPVGTYSCPSVNISYFRILKAFLPDGLVPEFEALGMFRALCIDYVPIVAFTCGIVSGGRQKLLLHDF